MPNEGLVDKRAYLNVIGCLMQDSSLIDDMDRPLSRQDFKTENFYELLFVAIYNLYIQGCQKIDEFAIDSYLSNYEKQYKIFQENHGLDYLVNAREIASLDNYDYFYHRVKKFSLLRYYESKGLDIRKLIYDWSVVEEKAAEAEKQKFDNYTEEDIVGIIENDLVITPKIDYCSEILSESIQAGEGMNDLIDELLEIPDFGFSFTSPMFNALCRGARRGKFYLRSATTSTGKSRNFLMDACNFAVPYTYDLKQKNFVYTGNSVPTLYVGTEGSLREFQTIVLATVSGVNETHILEGEYENGELDRVKQAAQYISESPLYLVYCDDFSITDIENIAKRYVLTYQVDIFIFDYLQNSLRLSNEVNSKSSMRMQEWQILLIFSARMKALAERLNIAVISGTQLAADDIDSKYKDHRILQGSKAIANKIDIGVIIARPSEAEKKKIEKLTHSLIGLPEINLLQWCYKVRSGKLSRIIVLSNIDLGTMRIRDCLATDFDFTTAIPIDITRIETVEKAVKKHSVGINEVNDVVEEANDESEKTTVEIETGTRPDSTKPNLIF
jgi:replicative DNA helicase